MAKKKFKTIGVLGGMGAAASADFYLKLVEIAQKKYHAQHDDDFPPIWIYNLPVVGFDETGFINPTSVKNQLISSAKKLEAAGSNFIIIPCNTVHYFFKEIQASIKIPFISILKITADTIKKAGYKKIGLLNSQSTKQYNLYETAFKKLGVLTNSTTESEQLKVNKVIGNVIGGLQGQKDIKNLNSIITRFKKEGAEAVVLGCTELPLAFSQKNCDLPVFDTTALLAEASLYHAYGK